MAFSNPCSEMLCNLMMALIKPGRNQGLLAPYCLQDQQEDASNRKGEGAFRVVGAEEVVVEDDGIHRPGIHEQDCNIPGMDHGVPRESSTQEWIPVNSSTNNPSPSSPRSRSVS